MASLLSGVELLAKPSSWSWSLWNDDCWPVFTVCDFCSHLSSCQAHSWWVSQGILAWRTTFVHYLSLWKDHPLVFYEDWRLDGHAFVPDSFDTVASLHCSISKLRCHLLVCDADWVTACLQAMMLAAGPRISFTARAGTVSRRVLCPWDQQLNACHHQHPHQHTVTWCQLCQKRRLRRLCWVWDRNLIGMRRPLVSPVVWVERGGVAGAGNLSLVEFEACV